jgi:hypothetical protein
MAEPNRLFSKAIKAAKPRILPAGCNACFGGQKADNSAQSKKIGSKTGSE